VGGLGQVLESLPSIVSVSVSRTPSAGALSGAYQWKVTFNAVVGDVKLLYAEGQLLSGVGAGITAVDACAWAPVTDTPSVSGACSGALRLPPCLLGAHCLFSPLFCHFSALHHFLWACVVLGAKRRARAFQVFWATTSW
jgi:hypothetical protein